MRLQCLHKRGTDDWVLFPIMLIRCVASAISMQDAGEEEEQEALGGVLRVRSRAKGASGAGEEGKGQQGGEEGAGRQDKTGKKKKGKQQGGEDGDRFQQVKMGRG